MKDRPNAPRTGKAIRTRSRYLTKNNAGPRNADRAQWGALAMANFAAVTGLRGDLKTDPETVLGDLLADLMHWCDVRKVSDCLAESIDFESALRRARDHYRAERR